MKQLIFILFLLIHCFSVMAQVPNFKEWTKQNKTQRKYLAQQIEALQVQLEYVKIGYKIVDKGLTTIGAIKNNSFNLDKDYFNSLKEVNPLIRKSEKVNEILVHQQNIITEFKNLIAYCKRDTHYTSGEITYIKAVYNGMLTQGKNAVDELTFITTATQAEMKDDERLQRLDKVHADLIDQHAFSKDFAAGTKLLALHRAKEEHEIQSIRKLYNLNAL